MASNDLVVKPGLDSDRYVGTREQLLATGLVTPAMFPGEPGAPRARRAATPKVRHLERYANGRYMMIVDIGDEERRHRYRRAAGVDADRELARSLACLPSSARECHQMLSRWTQSTHADGGPRLQRKALEVGYRFDDETIASYQEALDDAVRTIVAGCLVSDRSVLDPVLRQMRVDIARADSAFQDFARAVLGGEP